MKAFIKIKMIQCLKGKYISIKALLVKVFVFDFYFLFKYGKVPAYINTFKVILLRSLVFVFVGYVLNFCTSLALCDVGIVPRLMNWFDPKPGIVEQLQTGATTGVNVILTIAVVAIVAKGFNSGFFANIWNFNSDSHKLDELNKNYENLLLYLSDLHNKVDGLGWAVNRLNINENVLSNAHDIFRNEVLDEFNSIKKAFNEYIKTGGFPKINFLTDDLKKPEIIMYYETIILKDVGPHP